MQALSFLRKNIYLIIIIILSILYLRNILLPSSTQILAAGDIKHIYAPYREFLKNSIFSGQIPYWNPYLFSGTPFLAHPYTQFFYPTSFLLLFLPTNFYLSFVIFLHILFAAISMYWLLEKFTDRLSSIAGACVFTFSGYFVSRIYAGHIDYIISTALTPFIIAKALEYVTYDKKKALLWGSIAIAFQMFTGLLIVTFYICILAFFICAFNYKNIKTDLSNFIKKFILFFLAGFILSSAYVVPSYQFISQTIRGEGLSYNLASYGSATWQSLLLFINPNLLGSDFTPAQLYHGPPPDYAGFVFFIGITPLIIILIGILFFIFKLFRFKIINQHSRFFTLKYYHSNLIIALIAITILSIWVSLGPNAPINLHYILWNLLSIYKTTRLPVRHLVIAVFSLSFLFGITFSLIRNAAIKIALFSIILFELFSFSTNFLQLHQQEQLLPDDPVIKNILKDPETFRILPDFTLNSPVREQISFASPLTYKYFSTSGYTPAILTSYYDFIDRINGNYKRSLDSFSSEVVPSIPHLAGISYLNSKYIIVDKSADLLSNIPKQYKKLSETSLYRIYQSQNYLPRYFFVPETIVYNSVQELKDNLSKDQNNLGSKILIPSTEVFKITHQPNCGKNSTAKVSIEKYQLNSVSLSVDTPCNGFLSSSEVNFSGWEAKIDGKNVPIITSNLAFRSVNIPAGKHKIEFYYNPKIWIISLMISLSCLATLVIYTKIDIPKV